MLDQIRPHAAGLDLGSRQIFASVPGQPVRSFVTFTEDLSELCRYLKEQHIQTVAMEATGVYWIVLFDLLEQSGLEVLLVNGGHVKNLPGRKSDVADCQWLQQLHAHGLLRGSFVPPEHIRVLRSYRRLREDHVARAADCVRHMQKALDLMNIKLHTVISQLHGASGLAIVDAILQGERDPVKLAALAHSSIRRHKRDKVERSLRGTWKQEHLFALQQARKAHMFYQDQIAQCDVQIGLCLPEPKPEAPDSPGGGKTARHNAPQIDQLHQRLMSLTQGIDPTLLPGLTDKTLLQLLAETGTDLSRWPTSGHFTSWLGLAPSMHQSGQVRKSRRRRRAKTQAGLIFRLMAQSLGQSKYLALGGFYRRIKGRHGAPVAIVATARKLAVLYYNLMRHGKSYVEQGLEIYEEKYRNKILSNLKKRAQSLGFQLHPIQPLTTLVH